VYWEFNLAGVKHRVIVQAKNWARRVNKAAVLTFEAILRDLPGQPRGIIVTAKGCQKGALEVARSYGILICELRAEAPNPPIQLHYTGWMRVAIKGYRKTDSGQPLGLVNEITIVNPEFSNLMFQADAAWVRDRGGTLPLTSHLPHEFEFCDAEQRSMRTLREIYQDLAKELDERGETSARQSYSFDSPTFLKLPSTPSLTKVTGLSVDVTLNIEHREQLWKAANVVTFILKNLDDGQIRQFAKVPIS